MKKILVTTDFSTNSKAGIRFAIQLASQARCELIFYNVMETSDSSNLADHDYTELSVLDDKAQIEKLRIFITDIYKKAFKKAGELNLVIGNKLNIDAAIINYAQKCRADYICMSTRGGGIVDKFMGTNASLLITTSPVPLLVVPHTYRMKPLKSILYASDMEKIASELKEVQIFGATFDATIAVYNYDYFIEEDEVKSKLNKIAEKYSSGRITFHFKKLYAEIALLQQLQDDIRKSKPSLITMFTKQDRDWFERFFLSSKTAEMGFTTKTPMLVFRKHKK